MGRNKKVILCKKESRSSSSSSCEDSSSSSCNSSSSSSSCFDEEESSECFNPCSYKQSPICPRKVKTFKLDTCLISFKQRVLEVGDGCRYPTLDHALTMIKPNKGGYILKLRPGIHNLSRDYCLKTDDLTIIGDDCCPFSGFFYMQGGNHHVTSDFESCQELCPYDCKVLGEGPFSISTSGRRVIVKGVNITPNFSSACVGRSVGIVHTNGDLSQGEIISACGHSISVNADTGFGDTSIAGEGFFFYPNVIIRSATENPHITTTGRLTFVGVVFDGSDITIGSSGGVLSLKNCVSDIKPHLHITGRYDFTCPNTFLGTVFLAPSSSGTAFYQAVVGRNANLLVDSSGFHAWKYGFFCSTQIGAKLINSAEICFKGSQFVNNSQGISANAGTQATIYSTYFYGNNYAIVGINRCFFSSIPSDNSPTTNFIPVFRENKLVFIANICTIIIVPNATIENNTSYAVIDSTNYPTVEANIAGQFGRAFSLIIDSANVSNAQATEVDLFNNLANTKVIAGAVTTNQSSNVSLASLSPNAVQSTVVMNPSSFLM